MKKRVLIFSTAYHPFIGGAEVAVKEITDRLGDMFEFEMVTARMRRSVPTKEKIGNILVHRLGLGVPFIDKLWLAFCGASRAKKLNDFDIVWGIMASYGGLAASNYKKKHPLVKFLLTLQEGDSKEHIYKRSRWLGGAFIDIFKRADRIQAISAYLAEWAQEMGVTCPVVVVPNGITIQQFDHHGRKADIKRVITASRLVEKNGLEYLIKAMKIVKDSSSKPVVLKILGDGELKQDLEKLASDLGLTDKFVIRNVQFQGFVPNKLVYDYLNQADVFVRPSLSEGLGNSFLEAMAAGVPVVATPVGGIPDFLKDGQTGWFCKVKDPGSVAEKILYILDEKNKEPVSQVVKNAKELVETRYRWETIAGDMRNILNLLCVF